MTHMTHIEMIQNKNIDIAIVIFEQRHTLEDEEDKEEQGRERDRTPESCVTQEEALQNMRSHRVKIAEVQCQDNEPRQRPK